MKRMFLNDNIMELNEQQQSELRNKRLFLFDIDGTIALGDRLIHGTRELLQYITAIDGKAVFITNNSTCSIKDYIERFRGWGIETDTSNFVTASFATAQYLKEHHADHKIFVLGTRSLIAELRGAGLQITEQLEDDIECVLVSFDNELTYQKVETVSRILFSKEVDYVATNPDLCCPTLFGSVPDCGAICRMLACAVGREPMYIGKPSSSMVQTCMKMTGFSPEQTLVIGDRLYTDIACGINAGVDTALVFTGEAKYRDLKDTSYPPTFVFDDVCALYQILNPED